MYLCETRRFATFYLHFLKCKHATVYLHLLQRRMMFNIRRDDTIRKNRYGEITLCASNPRCITMNAAMLRLFHVTRFMNANIPGIKSHARSLHHSPFSFSFRAAFQIILFYPFLPLFFYVTSSLSSSVASQTLNLDPGLCTIHFRVYDLMNVTPHLPLSTTVRASSLGKSPVYALL